MNKSILLIFIFFSFNLYSQTTVSGNQSGTWIAGNSPYQVVGEIIVPNGETLLIEPGVEVNFQGHYKFTVNGLLEAVGTEMDSIRFTTDNPATGWGGLRLDNTNAVNTLSYCRIEFGKTLGSYPNNHGGALALLGSNAVVSNCVFADNEATGDDDGMGGAVYAINTGSSSGTLTRFTGCKFIRNHAYGEGGAIKFTSDMNSEIIDCEFIDNDCNYGGGAISFYTVTDIKMTRCLFADNYTMYSNGGAIHTLGMGNSLIFQHCTMYGNSAVTGDGGAVNLVYTNANFVNCIVQNNSGMYSDNIFLDLGGYAEINYCNLTMPDGATGTNNVDVDSEFVDLVNLDFHLLETSPCIDAGIDIGLPYTGDAPDMGCFEYQSGIGIIDLKTKDIIIFPNPTTDKLYLDNIKDLNQISLTDFSGRIIKNVPTDFSNNSIDLSDLTNGMYIINFQTGNKVITKIFIKI